MKLKILHLNIERDKHVDSVYELLKTRNPDVACFQEIFMEEAERISKSFGYEFAFAPLVIIKEEDKLKELGSAIFSKAPIIDIKKYRYDDNKTEITPVRTLEEISSDKNGERPKDRFLYHSTLLSVKIKGDNDKNITISTTHFPVTDHSNKGLDDHEARDLYKITEITITRNYLDRLIPFMRSIGQPVIFTADLNNPRGEYIYDTIAHELVDIVPSSIDNTIDSKMHYAGGGLKLVVDTIMTSPDVRMDSFEIIEGVSDHKGLIACLWIRT